MLRIAKLALALGTLSALNLWAVPLRGAAPFFDQSRRPSSYQNSIGSLAPIRFHDDRNAGLLVSGWIDDAGPFNFVIDTGAGVSIISSKVAAAAGLHTTKSSRPIVGGLSTSPITSNEESIPNKISLGQSTNIVPGKPILAIVPTLPGAIDGILDPTNLFGGMAYSIDLPNQQLLVFDGAANGLDLRRVPKDGAVVRWVREGGSQRPFVKLGDGRLALLDTGSGFGLAVNDSASNFGKNQIRRGVTDLGGGAVQSRAVVPTTISIGDLVLRNIPTDVLIAAPAGTPLILGRRALFPFKITFDPSARLIEFEPSGSPTKSRSH